MYTFMMLKGSRNVVGMAAPVESSKYTFKFVRSEGIGLVAAGRLSAIYQPRPKSDCCSCSGTGGGDVITRALQLSLNLSDYLKKLHHLVRRLLH